MYLIVSGSLVMKVPLGDTYSIRTLFPHSLEGSEIPKVDRVKLKVLKKKSERTRYLFQRWSQVQKLTLVNNEVPGTNGLTVRVLAPARPWPDVFRSLDGQNHTQLRQPTLKRGQEKNP